VNATRGIFPMANDRGSVHAYSRTGLATREHGKTTNPRAGALT
jgi:hypothetical protein